jgi:hypothetical protein
VQSRVFRAQALARFSSPEQLDQLLRVTSARSWLILAALAVVVSAAALWGFAGRIPRTVQGQGVLTRPQGVYQVVATTPVLVSEIVVDLGDVVSQGQTVAWVLAVPAQGDGQGTRVALPSPFAGTVIEILASPGDLLTPGSAAVRIDPPGKDLQAYLFVPMGSGKQIQPGMPVQLTPDTAPSEQYGFLAGRVRSITEYPATSRGVQRLLQNQTLTDSLLASGPVLEVAVDLEADDKTPTGFHWSTPGGPPTSLSPGTLTGGAVVLNQVRPVELFFPGWGR